MRGGRERGSLDRDIGVQVEKAEQRFRAEPDKIVDTLVINEEDDTEKRFYKAITRTARGKIVSEYKFPRSEDGEIFRQNWRVSGYVDFLVDMMTISGFLAKAVGYAARRLVSALTSTLGARAVRPKVIDTSLPTWGWGVLAIVVDRKNFDYVVGDIEEPFARYVLERGRPSALHWYRVQILKEVLNCIMRIVRAVLDWQKMIDAFTGTIRN